MDAFGKNAVSVIQSVLHEDLNAGLDVFKRKCLNNGEIMFHSALFKKDTEKVVLLN